MPVDPFAVLQALLRAEASRSRLAERRSAEPAEPAPAPAPERPAPREEPTR
ncbi:hypothetical protein [Streptomyces sp. NPDC058326]|uniref:hypothetical protein n=1 Tax=Streptomyces sp. NPDC058326 TaxID=3346447 RepID=UPI0036EB4C67